VTDDRVEGLRRIEADDVMSGRDEALGNGAAQKSARARYQNNIDHPSPSLSPLHGEKTTNGWIMQRFPSSR
jgi:hypothetical protein